MSGGEYLEYMQHMLNEGISFKPKSFRFTVLKKSVTIEDMVENIHDYIEPVNETIDQNELKVFIDFIKNLEKEEWRKMKAFDDNEIIPLI